MKSEAQIQSDITARMMSQGWYVIKLIQTNKNGIPDLVCVKDGQVKFIEVKRPGFKPRPLQDYRAKELRDHGCDVEVLTK